MRRGYLAPLRGGERQAYKAWSLYYETEVTCSLHLSIDSYGFLYKMMLHLK